MMDRNEFVNDTIETRKFKSNSNSEDIEEEKIFNEPLKVEKTETFPEFIKMEGAELTYSNYSDTKMEKLDSLEEGNNLHYSAVKVEKFETIDMDVCIKTEVDDSETANSCQFEDEQELLRRTDALHESSIDSQPSTLSSVKTLAEGYKVKLPENQELVQWFNCDRCDFKSTLKVCLKRHMPVHRSPLDIEWYECDLCDYKSILKVNLKRHTMSVHKTSLSIEWLKCHLCDYKSKDWKQKESLRKHVQLVHKNPSQMVWFKCDSCDYKTNWRGNLRRHVLSHKIPSDIEWFNCDSCDFKAKQKISLQCHIVVHKDPSQVKWYKCDLCEYKTQWRGNLRNHSVIHKGDSETEWFYCDLCDYKSRRKGNLRGHMAIHNSRKVRLYACGACHFKSKHKKYLECHQRLCTTTCV
ncbi:hypothetical protein NQ315_007398 [Exocentrus adspersus]|uniref:C2H2-type domain-containing protein n=1 Tax=Exocentrus adspersus TaxID=1586481 RepID=A0AAV8VH68_9CUCU|nr:hypothetical protein NQ315_007398 [Exocentrus adspersus]